MPEAVAAAVPIATASPKPALRDTQGAAIPTVASFATAVSSAARAITAAAAPVAAAAGVQGGERSPFLRWQLDVFRQRGVLVSVRQRRESILQQPGGTRVRAALAAAVAAAADSVDASAKPAVRDAQAAAMPAVPAPVATWLSAVSATSEPFAAAAGVQGEERVQLLRLVQRRQLVHGRRRAVLRVR